MTLAAIRPPGTAAGWAGPYRAAVALDARLGDPGDPLNPYGFAASVGRDALAEFPAALAEASADALGLSFVPAEHGGTLTTFDETLALVRVAARRDATVMPATMFSVTAATCVLLAGTEQQRAEVVRLLAGGHPVGFALSEPEHGSDLLANECRLEPTGADWRLAGGKWLVGLGQRAGALLVVARSGGRGPGAFSAVLLPRDAVNHSRRRPGQIAGMRGIDFANFAFDGCWVSGHATVGRRGRGLETAMKAMQVVRVLSTGANLACADTGLRLTLDFAGRHVVAGKVLAEHPHTRRELGTAGAALVACDAVALAATRALHTLPGAHSVWSSVAKKVLTDLSDEVFARCADVLGTRAQLAEGPTAAFDVARRDNAVVRYIDTGPVANLRLIAMQLPQLASALGTAESATVVVPPAVRDTFDLAADLPPVRLAALELSGRGHEPVLESLPAVATAVRAALYPAGQAGRRVAVLLDRAELGVAALCRDLTERGADPLDLAERFCFLHAATACVHLWWANRSRSCYGAPAGATEWLVGALALLLDRADGRVTRLPVELATDLFDVLAALHAGGRLFSAVPLPLAESDRGAEGTEQ